VAVVVGLVVEGRAVVGMGYMEVVAFPHMHLVVVLERIVAEELKVKFVVLAQQTFLS